MANDKEKDKSNVVEKVKDVLKGAMTIVYVGGAPRIKMGKYAFIKNEPRDVPIAIGKNLITRKISPFKEFTGTFTKSEGTKAIEAAEADAAARSVKPCC